MKMAKRIFLIAGIFGLLSTIPLAFAENIMEVKQPEYYFGFVFFGYLLADIVSGSGLRSGAISSHYDPGIPGKRQWDSRSDVVVFNR